MGTISYSANSVVQDNRKRGLQTDFVLNFIKTPNKKPSNLKPLSEQEETKIIRNLIQKYPDKDKIKVYELMNHVVISMIHSGYYFNLSNILKEIDCYINKN